MGGRVTSSRSLGAALIVAALVLAWSPPARAGVKQLVASKVLLRALAYDYKLASRAGDLFTITLLFDSGAAETKAEVALMKQAFGKLAGARIAGLPIAITTHDMANKGAAGLAKQLDSKSKGADALYVARGLTKRLSKILELSHKHKVATIATAQGHVRKGVSLAVDFVGGQPKLFVNLKGSRAEGMKLNAQLLRIATVIK